MALYLIGDIQGCNNAFQQLLRKIDFSPSRDTLYVLGDMVNRGEDSAGVLQTLMSFGTSAQCVLGNHDLHLLAVAHGARSLHPSDTLQPLLDMPSSSTLLEWLRHQKLAISLTHQRNGIKHRWLLVHAGVLPQWSADQTLALAGEVEAALQGADYMRFLRQMYGSTPHQWSADLQGADRLRVIVNALTRLRFCDEQGVMEFATKDGAGAAPQGFMPWFDVPHRKTATEDVSIAFGHWSTLGLFARPCLKAPAILGLDTGCVWGGALTAYCLSGRVHSVRNSAKLAAISAPISTTSHAI
ncbi:MAG: symmetrical bis(5'-nucleosyl)-tetraphosphatase [Cytophagales bacterium]|nr:symmetrical bis(5'-nucleosyl)-tetraphosphatase [Cytophagales bacterium]